MCGGVLQQRRCESKWIGGNDTLKLFMLSVSLQLESDNPHPGLNEGLFYHRSLCPGILAAGAAPLCSLCDFKGELHFYILFPNTSTYCGLFKDLLQ